MRRMLAAGMVAAMAAGLAACETGAGNGGAAFRDTFPVAKTQLSSSGTAKYFVLEPGFRQSYTSDKGTLVITVLNETKLVDGVETRIVEERETESGKLTEVSRNYFAIDRATGDVYYFGENVDMYKNNKVTSHEGSWQSGVDGARFGLMMPGNPKVGDKFQQEVAPQVAMDRVEITKIDGTARTPAGDFKQCAITLETNPIDKDAGTKTYAPGVGLVIDDEFTLVKAEHGTK